MKAELSPQWILFISVTVPSVLVVFLQSMSQRYGAATKAVVQAVDAQAKSNEQYVELQAEVRTLERTFSEERGAFKQQISSLNLQLKSERDSNVKLGKQMAVDRSKHSNQIKQLKESSNARIKELSDKLDKVMSQMSTIQSQLEKSESEKQLLIESKLIVEQERDDFEVRVSKAEEALAGIKRDIEASKQQYEKRIETLNQLIQDKDAEIVKLKKKLEEQVNEQLIQSDDDSGNDIAVGRADSGSRESDSDS